MKNYKHTYAASVPCFITELFIISLPGIVTLDIALSISDKVKMGMVTGMVLLSFMMLLVLGVLFSVLLTALINLFKDASVFLDEYNIEYKDTKLNLDSIEYITLFLPEMTSRLSATAQELSIYLNDKEHIVIRRPSIALTAYLKKRCKNAKFEIDRLGSRIKTDLIIAVCAAAVTVFLAMFTNKK